MHIISSMRKQVNCVLTVEEMLPSDESRVIEQAKFTYSPLGNGFEK